ncbi:Predicted oxidoreductase [Chitinophaga costaii]|uniref:Predicted oxidoreductase n=1 Tax=Chitinophaga costaii TaxID=1335309 RepID=A0A1C4G0J8_9BACT|nr:aldo/keto reductase [Chitinophaga costaii]PUZ19967.1 aldo/keto reductase [Chitinophaga costaii]SCC61644.1 Predicted oxidoreductase [Chitinophaga costaii]
MLYHPLGKSALHVSEIAFGGMSLKGAEASDIALLHQALDSGINFFDTADLYDQGANETLFGKAFKDRRDQVVLATKVGNQLRPDGSGWDWNPRKDYILESVHHSLRRLQTDYIDLYQLHGGTLDDPTDETIAAFEQLQQEGKIRYYGISSIRPDVIRTWVERAHLVSVMMQYSLLDRRPEESTLSLLEANNIGVLARGSVAKGLLAGKPATEYLDYSPEAVQTVQAAVKAASGQQRSMGQTAMRYVLQHPAITSLVVGIRTTQQLEEALGAASAPALTPAAMQDLAAVLPDRFYESHR